MESPKEKSNKLSKPEAEDSDQNKKPFMRFYSLVLELVVMNLALIMGGYYLDDFLGTSPLVILLGTFAAMAGTIWLLLKSLK